MTYTYIQGGWTILIPTILQVIFLSTIIITTFFTGRALALNHLIKHHLQDIEDSEIRELRLKVIGLTKQNRKLFSDKKKYMEILSGIKYLTKKEGL